MQNFLESKHLIFTSHQKSVPPRYIFHFRYLPGTKHFSPLSFRKLDTIPKLHGFSTVLDRGRDYSNSFISAEGCTLPTTNSVTAGNHSRIVRRQYTSVGRLIETFYYVHASYDLAVSIRFSLTSYCHDRRPSCRTRW